ncbi:MAG: hypothetical protein CVU84_10280 [Firmicutes bacterium HGW-Firmicutes-1]|nr:MAG: hypothetical protein CVU84_10280 [Firmicutes bacterium HGW-Firmicutes-1]
MIIWVFAAVLVIIAIYTVKNNQDKQITENTNSNKGKNISDNKKEQSQESNPSKIKQKSDLRYFKITFKYCSLRH